MSSDYVLHERKESLSVTRTFSELIDQGVLEIGDGYRAKNDELGGNGLIFLRAGHVRDTHIDFDGVEHFKVTDKSKFKGKLASFGDVVVTTKGNSTGRIAFVTQGMPEFVYSPHLSFWRSRNESVLCQGFLRAWSRGEEFSSQLQAMSRSTDMAPYLSLTDQKRLQITLPILEQQRAVSNLLDGLEDRITLLRETNATLEAIAQALFKSWFVDFDPVRAKAEGLEPEGMDAATAALFPDSFEESAFGLVPKRWGYSTIGQSFILTMGQSPPGDTYNETGEGLPFYQGRTDFGFRFPTQRIFCNAPTRLAEVGDTLVSVRAPVGDVNVALHPCALGRGVASVRHPEGHQSFVFYSVRILKQHFELYDGEGTVFGSINKKDFQTLPVIQPSESVLRSFESTVSPLDSAIELNEQKLRTLTKIRDTLLPRLISGQLRLPETETSVENILSEAV